MTKRIASKNKICRRLGVQLWGNSGNASITTKAPGEHGNQKGRVSEYGSLLLEKQKFRSFYGQITETIFQRVVLSADKMHGDFFDNLVGLMESRLQTVVYRSGIVSTIHHARQLISHGHVRVNGTVCVLPGRVLRAGDIISVSPTVAPAIISSIRSQMQEDLRQFEAPSYLEVDYDTLHLTFLHVPSLLEVEYPVEIDTKSIREFYSR